MLKALELDSTGELKGWLKKTEFDKEVKVEAVKKIYRSLKVDELAFKLMDKKKKKAISSLEKINAQDNLKSTIIEFSEELMKRSS